MPSALSVSAIRLGSGGAPSHTEQDNAAEAFPRHGAAGFPVGRVIGGVGLARCVESQRSPSGGDPPTTTPIAAAWMLLRPSFGWAVVVLQKLRGARRARHAEHRSTRGAACGSSTIIFPLTANDKFAAHTAAPAAASSRGGGPYQGESSLNGSAVDAPPRRSSKHSRHGGGGGGGVSGAEEDEPAAGDDPFPASTAAAAAAAAVLSTSMQTNSEAPRGAEFSRLYLPKPAVPAAEKADAKAAAASCDGSGPVPCTPSAQPATAVPNGFRPC